MKKLFILLLLSVLFASCKYRPMELTQVSEYCFVIQNYNKTICLETPYDTLHPILYIDKNPYEMKDRKFSDLKMYKMMVVEIKENEVLFSNLNYSIRAHFDEINTENSRDIKVQDIYYIIVKRVHLSDTKVVIKSNGQKEPLPDEGGYDGVDDMSNMIDMMDPDGGGYEGDYEGYEGEEYEEQGSGYDNVEDP